MSTSRRSTYHHGDLRDALIDAGLELLVEQGIDGLSLRAAARAAGVSPMAPYRHFPDKVALLTAIADRGFLELARRLSAADQQPQPVDALRAQAAAYVLFAVDQPALFRLMFGPSQSTGGMRAAGMAAFEIMSQRVQAVASAEDAAESALMCWSFVHGLASLILDRRIPNATDPAATEHLTRRLSRFLTFVSEDGAATDQPGR